jgi:hypothetical protein
MKKVLSARIEETIIKQIEKLAKEKGITKAEAIEKALKDYLMRGSGLLIGE